MERYRVVGRIHTMDRKVHNVDRTFEASITNLPMLAQKALCELGKRKDKGSPWYGDAVVVVDKKTSGDKFTMVLNVPYPSVNGH